ncbi:MAG: S8 family serine peptidase [Mycetocola sp.]
MDETGSTDSTADHAGSADGVHEMRIGVESAGTQVDLAGQLAPVVNGILAGWHIAPLFADDDSLWLLTGTVAQKVGTAEYATLAHSLVQNILATGVVARAEADLPVTAFVGDPVARPVGLVLADPDSPPGSESMRWARDAIRCDGAWAIEPRRGAGILIGQPDTGYTLHPNLGRAALNLAADRDFIDNDNDARDPLVPPDTLPWPLSFPGHGTTTASVMVGRGSEQAGIVGVAPRAKVLPLRAARSVIQLFDSDVARAVDHARRNGCHLLSISVGGKGFFGLRAAIQRSVDAGMIVVAAAGNNVAIVVAPASYPNCLAVAATGPDDQPWPGSSHGRAVDVSAPGWGVHVAGYIWERGSPTASVKRSSGTSYATTHVSGVAALWIAHHGPEALRERYGGRVQAVFLHLLTTIGSRVPAGWDPTEFGAGIVDAAALLAAPLPASHAVTADTERPAVESPLARLGALVSVSETELERCLAEWLRCDADLAQQVAERFEGELAFHLIEHAGFRESILGGATSAHGDVGCLAGSSAEFRSAVRSAGSDVSPEVP